MRRAVADIDEDVGRAHHRGDLAARHHAVEMDGAAELVAEWREARLAIVERTEEMQMEIAAEAAQRGEERQQGAGVAQRAVQRADTGEMDTARRRRSSSAVRPSSESDSSGGMTVILSGDPGNAAR